MKSKHKKASPRVATNLFLKPEIKQAALDLLVEDESLSRLVERLLRAEIASRTSPRPSAELVDIEVELETAKRALDKADVPHRERT